MACEMTPDLTPDLSGCKATDLTQQVARISVKNVGLLDVFCMLLPKLEILCTHITINDM